MSHAPIDLATCPNCGADLTGAYCAACGQKRAAINPSLHDFLHDAVHEFLHVDGRLFSSVRNLLLRPGFLAAEYFSGRRASYLTAIRLYLIFSVLYFAVAAALPQIPVDLELKVGGDAAAAAELQALGFGNAEALQVAIVAALKAWIPRVMFVLVPLFGALVMAVLRHSGRNYPQHLVFALHVHAAWFVAAAAGAAIGVLGAGWLTAAVQIAAWVYALGYLVLAFKAAYKTTAAGAVWRAAAVLSVYVVAVGVAIVAIILPVVLPRS